jgi:hypothetical protein
MDGNPVNLHFVMFLPTLMGQATPDQISEVRLLLTIVPSLNALSHPWDDASHSYDIPVNPNVYDGHSPRSWVALPHTYDVLF